MGIYPTCPKCGYQFAGFMMPEMVGEKCPACGELITQNPHFPDGSTTTLSLKEIEKAQELKNKHRLMATKGE